MSNLKVGPTYNFGSFDNKFIVIATTNAEAWIKWCDDGNTEVVSVTADSLVTDVTLDL